MTYSVDSLGIETRPPDHHENAASKEREDLLDSKAKPDFHATEIYGSLLGSAAEADPRLGSSGHETALSLEYVWP